jgi:hypothetical protein
MDRRAGPAVLRVIGDAHGVRRQVVRECLGPGPDYAWRAADPSDAAQPNRRGRAVTGSRSAVSTQDRADTHDRKCLLMWSCKSGASAVNRTQSSPSWEVADGVSVIATGTGNVAPQPAGHSTTRTPGGLWALMVSGCTNGIAGSQSHCAAWTSASHLADDNNKRALPTQPQLHWPRLLWRGRIAITTPLPPPESPLFTAADSLRCVEGLSGCATTPPPLRRRR